MKLSKELLFHVTTLNDTRTRLDSSGRVIGPSQRPVHGNTKHSQDSHAPDGIRTRIPSKRAAADSRLRSRGIRDQAAVVALLEKNGINDSQVTQLSLHSNLW
jgi:hypothetical protein